ncbi:MAG: hypothetical protein AMK70_00830 [Nitrospira bacterium SG8_35_1]|nr:MAG: hypothetical protein AMK70_00830 [Nitrospira bacterium SG8_35_1]
MIYFQDETSGVYFVHDCKACLMSRSGIVDIAGDIGCKVCISSPNHQVEFIHYSWSNVRI